MRFRVLSLTLAIAFATAVALRAERPPLRSQAATTQTPATQDTAPKKPKVVLFATGGTISNRNGGRLTVNELIESIPRLDQIIRAEGEQLGNVSSGAVTMQNWLDWERRINEKLRACFRSGLD